jgi:hypothetical protein
MAASIRLPTGELDEDRAIDLVATVLIPMVRHKLTPEFSREWLETTLQQGLREGQLSLTRHAIEAAEAGDEICDSALRHVYLEIARGELSSGPGQHLYVRQYVEHAVLQSHKRRPGRPWHDNYIRDIQICRLIDLVCREFGVRPTRNRSDRRANRAPSGVGLVVAALARNGIHLDEANVQEHIWLGPPGKLVRTILAGA